MNNILFELRGVLSKRLSVILNVSGIIGMLLIWSGLTYSGIVNTSLLPSPSEVISGFIELLTKDALIENLLYSLWLNFLGYSEAIIISLPLGFVVALFPLTRELFKNQINAIRFLPITALTGIFIMWFGIYTPMKAHFLAFGIIVYLLPVVMQRVYSVEQVYVDTVTTLGANKWQTIKKVFIPSVMLQVFDDVRVLTAISWTYIIVAELVNKEKGVGALIYTCQRQSRIDKAFAVLFVILLVGFLLDRIFLLSDKILFRSKYYSEKR